MTRPLTPREKVADDLKLVIAHTIVEELRSQHPDVDQIDNDRGDLWLPGGSTPQSAGCVIDLHAIAASVEREMDGFLKSSYQAGWNDREGDFLVGCDRVVGRTALASGSGDHAGLLRTALQDSHELARRGLNPDVRLNEAERAAVTALLAENAALRAAKTEAERKLAEAVATLELAAIRFDEIYEAAEVDDVAYRNEATIHGINGLADVAQAEIRTFLSKEAERG